MSAYIPPKVGDRTDDERPLEWIGSVWTPVCLPCDKPMDDDRDSAGWLRCGVCGLPAVDR